MQVLSAAWEYTGGILLVFAALALIAVALAAWRSRRREAWLSLFLPVGMMGVSHTAQASDGFRQMSGPLTLTTAAHMAYMLFGFVVASRTLSNRGFRS